MVKIKINQTKIMLINCWVEFIIKLELNESLAKLYSGI